MSPLVLAMLYAVLPLVALILAPLILAPMRGFFNVREAHHGALGLYFAICFGILVQGATA